MASKENYLNIKVGVTLFSKHFTLVLVQRYYGIKKNIACYMVTSNGRIPADRNK